VEECSKCSYLFAPKRMRAVLVSFVEVATKIVSVLKKVVVTCTVFCEV